MIKVVISSAVVLAASLSSPLAAAPMPGSTGDTAAAVAECVVDNDADDVRILLKTIPGSPAEAAAAKPVMDYYGGCNDNKAMGGAIAWRERAEIANAALIKRMGKRSPDVSAASQPGWALDIGKGKVAGADYDAGSVGTRMLGDCIVRAAPQAAVDLARSATGSAAEQAAIGQLSTVLAPCIPAGQNMRVKRTDLRLIVAEPLYHLLGS
jgi:hypothetical protein